MPFDEATLRDLYPSKQDFVDEFTTSLDDAIAGGFVRESDREAYLARAEEAPIPDRHLGSSRIRGRAHTRVGSKP